MPGDRLTPPSAGTTNALRATAREVGTMKNRQSSSIPQSDPSVMLVKNVTETDLPFLAVVGLEGPVLDPADSAINQSLLLNHLVFELAWPATNQHRGRFAILLNGIKAGDYGPARFCDKQLAAVDEAVEVGQFVDVASEARLSENILSRVPGGAAKVLWVGPMVEAGSVSQARAGSASVNEIQTVTLGRCNAGTFTLEFDDTGSNPQTTAEIPFDAANAEVKSALEALSNIDNVDVTGGPLPLFPVAIEFRGVNALTNLRLMEMESSLTGYPQWAVLHLNSDAAEIILAIVLSQLLPAAGPLTGASCFQVIQIRDAGPRSSSFIAIADSGSMTGFAWSLVESSCSVTPSVADLTTDIGEPTELDETHTVTCADEVCANDFEVFAPAIDCVNRSVDATAAPGTFCRISSSGGEFGLEWLDCHITEEGLQAVVEALGFGITPIGDGVLGTGVF